MPENLKNSERRLIEVAQQFGVLPVHDSVTLPTHTRVPFQCPICGAFIRRAVRGECKRCGTEWSNA